MRSEQGERRRLFALGCALGVAAFLVIFGAASLDVTNDAFARGGFVEKDIQQHYAGWLYYRRAAWGLPLGLAQGIDAPRGLSVLYTDSIPLFAVLFKLLSPLLPGTCQYFGWFSLCCYALMGGFAALLLSLFIQSRTAVLLGTLPFVFSPVLAERALHHTSLTAQFFVLAALYYYFRAQRENSIRYPVLYLCNALLFAVHPYFIPVCYAVTFAMLAQYALRQRRFAGPLLALAGDLAATLAVGALFGVFHSSPAGGSDYLYGYFGMNLNALWNPTSVGGAVWSLLLPVQNQVGGNYDAFAYLGLGVLAALAVAAAAALKNRRDTADFIRRNAVLLLCCLALTAFAVSHVVTANGATLLRLPLPERLIRLASVFRAGGRMFWPCYYLLMLWAVTAAARLGGRRLAPAALAVLAAVQLADLSPAFIARHRALAQYTEQFPTSLTGAFWADSAGRYAHLFSLGGRQADSLHLALYTADNGMDTNDPFAARYDAAALALRREEAIEALKAGQAAPDTLYFTGDEGIFLQLAPYVQNSAFCARLAEHQYVIAPGYTGDADGAVLYGEDYPVRIADYTDGNWDAGVLDWDDCTVLFTDCLLTRAFLDGAAALRADGQVYAITEVSDRDAGWLMVTLDIGDARCLQGVVLEAVK